jgi:CubicO group peptidase (beta-lactamase class C family)
MRSKCMGSVVAVTVWTALSLVTSAPGIAHAQVSRRVDPIFAECKKPGSPGAAVAITHGGQVVYLREYGLANLEHGIPVVRETRFELASVSKQFTALAVFLLEHDGRLSLHDSIRKFLPELPDYTAGVEIQHVIYHTSGLPEYSTVARLAGFGETDVISFDDLLAMLQHWAALYSPPGSGWRYTNTEYALLAAIVWRVTGEPFAEWMREHVFGPLQMDNTLIQSSALQVIPARAEGYAERDGGFVLGREMLGDFPGAAHAYSTIDDMVKWLENFRTMTVGGADVMRKMFVPDTLNDGRKVDYAGGLYVWQYRGATVFSHAGVGGGFRTNVTYSPDADVGIVVLSNNGSIEPTLMGLRILDAYEGKEPAATPHVEAAGSQSRVELAAGAYEGFPGRYLIDGAGIAAAIWRDGSQWMGAMEGMGVGPLYPRSDTELASDDDSVRVAFVAGEAGAPGPPRIRVTKGDQELTATKVVTGAEPTSTDYAGHYYSDELGAVYELTVAADGLHIQHRNLRDMLLHPLAGDGFAGETGILRFQRDDQGRVQGFTLHQELLPDRGVRFSKIGG